MARKQSKERQRKPIFLPDEDMADGAAMAMAAEMSGMDYEEYCMELVAESEEENEH